MINLNVDLVHNKFMKLADSLDSSLECPHDCQLAINTAAKIRSLARSRYLMLTNSDKVKVITSLARAKIRAYKFGSDDGIRAYKELDMVSKDLIRLL